MAGSVITVAQQKGGAGKTTLVAHLAIAFRQLGNRVAIVDVDPQGSLTAWHAARTAALGESGLTHSQINGWRTAGEVDKLAREHDLVVVDSPPHAETEARIAVRAAKLVIIPVQPSPMDVWATRPTLDLAAAERIRAMLVLNRVPPRGKLTEELSIKLNEMGAHLAATRIGNRVAYAAALLSGRSVTEGARGGNAAKEMRALAGEILGHVA